ncbi:MAG TPA: hypothetical protein VFJ90_00990, partial [Candidatus Didemnitutus sp.]|nr:hypothetical protein [Candidatus Didemnitutus sp.]
DEYQVRVTNLSQQLLRIESAMLVDFQGQAQPTGWDPWQLEKQSATNWDVYRAGGTQLRAGAGAADLKSGAGSVVSTDAALRGAALHDVVPAEFVHGSKTEPAAPGGEKDKVAREFARRRLFLPVTMPPGGMIEGSLFFPMTPGPQRLVLRGRYGDSPVVLTLELQPMAALHLKPPGEPGDEEYAKRFWSWLQKSWDSAFSSAPTAKVEK